MNIPLKFAYGKSLMSGDKKNIFSSGTIYLDIETHELFFDNPEVFSGQHQKIIDNETLIYTISNTVDFPSNSDNDGTLSSSTTAKLGVAILGAMKLGNNE